MPILVDYACSICHGQAEHWVDTPIPAATTCPACGADALRRWSPAGLIRLRDAGGRPANGTTAAVPEPGPAALCARNPDIPGLCHMSPTAARSWIARARKDNRALEREIARQESAAAVRSPALNDIVSHAHSHGSRSHARRTANGADPQSPQGG